MIIIESIKFENIDLTDSEGVEVLTQEVEISAYDYEIGSKIPFTVKIDFTEYQTMDFNLLIKKCEETYKNRG